MRGWAPTCAAVVLMALLLTSCQDAGGQLSLADLKALPGTSTAYPGATEYRRLETDASANAMAKNPALIKVDACAAAPRPRVRAWFSRRLRGAGWSRDPGTSPVEDAGEFLPMATDWSHGDRHFELRFLTDEFADHLAEGVAAPTGCPAAYETIVD